MDVVCGVINVLLEFGASVGTDGIGEAKQKGSEIAASSGGCLCCRGASKVVVESEQSGVVTVGDAGDIKTPVIVTGFQAVPAHELGSTDHEVLGTINCEIVIVDTQATEGLHGDVRKCCALLTVDIAWSESESCGIEAEAALIVIIRETIEAVPDTEHRGCGGCTKVCVNEFLR